MIVSVTPPGVPRKILVVDDLPAIRNGLKQLLEIAGYRVVVAGSFAEGRFALSEDAPDLLISDVRLGEYNGIQLVATTTRVIPAIIITGFPDPVLEAEARRLGADFLIKPVESATLLALIKRKLQPIAEPGNDRTHKRRWERKPVTGDLRVRVNDAAARVVDISYGGLKFELERGENRPVPPVIPARTATDGRVGAGRFGVDGALRRLLAVRCGGRERQRVGGGRLARPGRRDRLTASAFRVGN